MKATAIAHPNIALVKYWGKRDQNLNLPDVGSISLTLKELQTITTVEFKSELRDDLLYINRDSATIEQTKRVSRFLDIIREQAKMTDKAEVHSENNFPTGAGLASSASAFASLAMAASHAAKLKLSASRLSEIARRGSGSAARSIFGGFAEMNMGELFDGSDAIAHQLIDENQWDVRILIGITSELEKEVSSTQGMFHTATSSPYYKEWVDSSRQDLEMMRSTIMMQHFDGVGEIAEHNCLKMHAVMLAAQPGLIYWNGTTVEAIHAIRRLRKEGISVYFTIDAGPQVKAICLPHYVQTVRQHLETVPGIKRVIETSPGPGTRLMEKSE